MDHLSDCGVTPSRREELTLSDPKDGVAGVQHRTPRRGQKSTILGWRSGLFGWPRAWPRLVRKPQRLDFSERVDGVVRDVAAFRVVALADLITHQFYGHTFAGRRGTGRRSNGGVRAQFLLLYVVGCKPAAAAGRSR